MGPGAGPTVFAHLCRYRHSDAQTWAKRLARGEVTLNGALAGGEEPLRPGDTLVWHRPPWVEEAAPLHYALLRHEGGLLAVAKPSGLPTLPGGGFLEHTLLALVTRDFPGYAPLHRLGRGTSGVVLFAQGALRGPLRARWQDGVRKHYRALVTGEPPWDERELLTPIGPVPHPRLGTVWAASPCGKPAHSRARVLERRPGETLLAVEIFSGRPHQIRIHTAAAGLPLRGDPLYLPGGRPRPDALPGDGGYLLHAHELLFVHPLSGERWRLVAPPPPELRAVGEAPGYTGP